jgi:small redox-active disulfide protein 2
MINNVKIVGADCANCMRLEAIPRKAVTAVGVPVEVEKVTDYAEIMQWPILSTPALPINNKLVSARRTPTEAEIAGWLNV